VKSYPKQFKYGGIKYRIISEEMPGFSGMVTKEPPVIRISPKDNQTAEEYRKTLLHEILHVILWNCAQNKQSFLRLKEETLVAFLEKEMFEAKRLNPKLFKFLFG
jgi:hypothetical protein